MISEEAIYNRYLANMLDRQYDDCSVLSMQNYSASNIITSIDSSIEGVHFLDDIDPYFIAIRSMNTAFSDIYASGGQPLSFMMNLCLNYATTWDWLDRFFEGLTDHINHIDVEYIGGNTNIYAHQAAIAMTVFGYAENVIYQSNAERSHNVFVTGTLGESAIGFLHGTKYYNCYQRYIQSVCRKDYASIIADCASAAIDISDGLWRAIKILENNSSVKIRLEHMPVSAYVNNIISDEGHSIEKILDMSDDYEILFTSFMSKSEILDTYQLPVYHIGQVI